MGKRKEKSKERVKEKVNGKGKKKGTEKGLVEKFWKFKPSDRSSHLEA
jgi:hypothetical protein